MYTSASRRPTSLIIRRSNCPERPINGLPVFASFFPGASPKNMISASGFPSPGTGRPLFSALHSAHAAILFAIFCSAMALSIQMSIANLSVTKSPSRAMMAPLVGKRVWLFVKHLYQFLFRQCRTQHIIMWLLLMKRFPFNNLKNHRDMIPVWKFFREHPYEQFFCSMYHYGGVYQNTSRLQQQALSDGYAMIYI